jgi:hypothetical protein
MRRLPAAALLCALLIVGCGKSAHKQSASAPVAPKPQPTIPVRKGDERVIRGWNKAENAGDFEHAARFFARNAIVIQSYILKLPTHRLAVEWNSGLPCRADITFLKGERATTLVGFDLRKGPGGKCNGAAQVRFTIRGGLIRQWRQLPENEQEQTAPAL